MPGCGRIVLLLLALSSLLGAVDARASGPAASDLLLPGPHSGLHHPAAVDALLTEQGPGFLWSEGLELLPRARVLIERIALSERDGLDPRRYHLDRLQSLLAGAPWTWPDEEAARAAEPLLTDACLTLGRDLARGRVEPEAIWEKWRRVKSGDDGGDDCGDDGGDDPVAGLMALLRRRPAADELAAALDALRPPQPEYRLLQDRLLELGRITAAGGWTRVELGQDLLKPGASDPGIASLRRRLLESGDLPVGEALRPRLCPPGPADVYDRTLTAAVEAFQRRHGLEDDGVVGPLTLRELNATAQERAMQLALNLERWRWLPRDPGAEHVRVNIPDFRLELRRDGRTVVGMKAIVGRADRPTPIVSGRMGWLVLNPYWNVPQKLARLDLLPKIRKDDRYLPDHGFRVYADWSDGAAEIDPASVDWAGLISWNLAFRFRQDPGPLNPLGKVKFIFPNEFRVFLHDTDARGKFDHTVRMFSSGCVRLERPLELLDALLDGGPAWARRLADETLAGEENRSLDLPRPVPVHLVYLTAWVDDGGRLQLRPDCYGYDAELAAALAGLEEREPARTPAADVALLERVDSVAIRNDHQVRTGPVSTWTNPGPE